MTSRVVLIPKFDPFASKTSLFHMCGRRLVRRRAAETPTAAMEGTSAKTGLLNELLANNSSYASGFNKPMSLGVQKKVCVWAGGPRQCR